MRMRDLKNQRFGFLTAKEPLPKRDKGGSIIWRCECDCGAITDVDEYSLVSGNTQSCGCKKKASMLKTRSHQTYIDGTCIEILEKRKHRSDNTSGFRGVIRIRPDKWRVIIGFRGKQRHIGYFSDFEDAVKARLYAESQYYEPFLKEYYTQVLTGG